MNSFKRMWLFLVISFIVTGFMTINNLHVKIHAQELDETEENNPQDYSGYGCINGEDLHENISKEGDNNIPESSSGFGCSSTCGASRENGYSSTYHNGCRNWQVMPIISPLYKYWIDESTLSDLSEAEKKQFIDNVDKAASEWNSVRIASYSGAIVNLQKQSTNGPDVVPVRYSPSLNEFLGRFNPIPLHHEIEIKYFDDYDTIMHEFGHMIGLQDLDMNNNPYTHISLMGYNSDNKLHYQDIQGLAVANSKHPHHDYRRYWQDGNFYKYVCFYCDATDLQLTPCKGGSHLEEASSCIHLYEQLASAKNRCWLKCTKCYKVVESEYNVIGVNDNGTCVIKILSPIDNNSSYVTIPNSIGGQSVKFIGSEAFKDCTTICSITIPNTITNIDSSAFENCSGLLSITFSSSTSAPSQLYAIGTSAFKGCTSLNSITLPESVQHIDDGAFQNCTNLSSVTVKRDTASITHLGVNVFKDCKSTLQITVPSNRVAEYKNKVYWSSYSSKIAPNNSNFTSYTLDDSTNRNISTTLSAGKNKLYSLVVVDSSTYNIKATASNNVLIKLYDSNMNHIASASHGTSSTLSKYLKSGIYYYSVEYSNNTSSGTVNTNIAYIEHVHSYEYKIVNSEYHILKCVCGVTSGTKERHTIDGSYVDLIDNGRYKPCLYCGADIDTWAGGMYPIALNNQTVYVIFENRLGNTDSILSEMEFINKMLINSIVQYSLNGSYKLAEGTIILVEEDVIAFVEGTLIFYVDDESLVTE